MSVHIEERTLVIELETNSPQEFYQNLLKELVSCIQAMSETDIEEVYFLLELYKALLPEQEQVNKMFGKKTT